MNLTEGYASYQKRMRAAVWGNPDVLARVDSDLKNTLMSGSKVGVLTTRDTVGSGLSEHTRAVGVHCESGSPLFDRTVMRWAARRTDQLIGCFSGKLDDKVQEVRLRIQVQENGAISRGKVEKNTFGSTDVGGCILKRVLSWRFPAPGSEPVDASLGLVFEPRKR